MVANSQSTPPLNGNQETTHKSTYKNETVSKINDTGEIPEGTFPINQKLMKKINIETPYYWLNIKRVSNKNVLFVEEVI